MSSNEYLTRVNLMHAADDNFDTPIVRGKNVAVIGGGNTAMDSVRTARRLGAKRAMIIYRRSEEEMPARLEEVQHAKEEGVEFMTLHNPIEYIGDEKGHVVAMVLQKMQLGEPDASGRRRPVPIEGAVETIPVDQVIVSVGVSPNPLVPRSIEGLAVSKKGTIEVDADTMQSSIPTIFAGCDIVQERRLFWQWAMVVKRLQQCIILQENKNSHSSSEMAFFGMNSVYLRIKCQFECV